MPEPEIDAPNGYLNCSDDSLTSALRKQVVGSSNSIDVSEGVESSDPALKPTMVFSFSQTRAGFDAFSSTAHSSGRTTEPAGSLS